MSEQLSQAIAALHLQPGEVFRTTVEGKQVEVRMVDGKSPHGDPEERSRFEDMVMLEPWFSMPAPEPGINVHVQFGPSRLPDPPIIPPDDETE